MARSRPSLATRRSPRGRPRPGPSTAAPPKSVDQSSSWSRPRPGARTRGAGATDGGFLARPTATVAKPSPTGAISALYG